MFQGVGTRTGASTTRTRYPNRLTFLVVATVLQAAMAAKYTHTHWRGTMEWGRALRLCLRGGHGNCCACSDKGDEAHDWLYDEINFNKSYSLNTEKDHGIHEVLRPACQKDDDRRYLKTSDDAQALLIVTFNQLVNIASISFTNGLRPDSRVKELRVFGRVDKEILDFEDAEATEAHITWNSDHSASHSPPHHPLSAQPPDPLLVNLRIPPKASSSSSISRNISNISNISRLISESLRKPHADFRYFCTSKASTSKASTFVGTRVRLKQVLLY